MAGRHRRRSRGRRLGRFLLTLAILGGLVVGSVAGYQVVRRELDDERAVLATEASRDDAPPPTLPVDAASVERVSPLELRIESLGLEEFIRPVGLADSGELEVPDETEIGWYEQGSAPGLPGSTVLAAHVSWNHTLGPFHDLGDIALGSTVDVVSAGGIVRTYQVVERAMYDKDELPSYRIWRTTGDEALVLITCGGDFDGNRRRYRQNIVVYAVPVAEATEPSPATSGA